MEAAAGGKIIFVRHGETEANRRQCFAASDDVPLTEAGRLQAQEAADRIAAGFRPVQLFSSRPLRAMQTSETLGLALGLQPETIAGIQEREFGCLKGQAYTRMGEMMTAETVFDPCMWSPDGGESLEDVRRRAVAACDDLRRRYAGQEIVVVSHGAVIQAVCAHITGAWSEAFVPPVCGVIIVGFDVRGWKQPLHFDALRRSA